MTDIYGLLNKSNVDPDEFEEIDATEFEKAKVKNALKQSIGKKKKRTGWKTNVAAASVMLCLSAAALGSAFPTYASGIPVIGDIFKYLDIGNTGMYDNYKEHSSALNLSKESSGVKVTINDVIYDRHTVSMTFTLESDQDLGENPTAQGTPKLEGSEATAALSTISKVGENRYVGLYQATSITGGIGDTVNITWNLGSINPTDEQKEIQGDWEFAFAANATDTHTLVSGQSAEQDGVMVGIEKITITPMSFIVYYTQAVSELLRNQGQGVYIDLQIKDDLGNVYTGQDNGGVGRDSSNISRCKSFGKLDPNASKLIVTPRVLNSFNIGEVAEDEPKDVPLLPKFTKSVDFVLDDIVIELDK